MPNQLDRPGHRESNDECEDEPLPWLLLEGLAADVAEHHRVRTPDQAGDDVVADEPPPRHPVDEAGREGDHGPATRYEARDDNDVTASFIERLPRPEDPFLVLLALEEALVQPFAEKVPGEEADVVTGDRPQGGREDHELDPQTACSRDYSGRDCRRLA